MSSPVARALRMVSITICLIVAASFLIFAVNQTRGASSHQQEVVNGNAPAAGAPGQSTRAPGAAGAGAGVHENAAHRTIDSLSNAFTTPFKAVTAGSSSEWVVRGVNMLLALLLYGFGLGFLARVIRVRV